MLEFLFEIFGEFLLQALGAALLEIDRHAPAALALVRYGYAA